MNIVQHLAATARQEDLNQSLRNCHVLGLHSIVLRNFGGRLTRAFFTSSNHEMHLNLDPSLWLSLGIHNHLYNLDITTISGTPYNVSFEETEGDYNVDQYTYQSKIAGGRGAAYNKAACLEMSGITLIDKLHIPHEALHTVFVPRGQMACWLVQEGVKVKDTTKLYQNGDTSGTIATPFDYPVMVFVNEFFGE